MSGMIADGWAARGPVAIAGSLESGSEIATPRRVCDAISLIIPADVARIAISRCVVLLLSGFGATLASGLKGLVARAHIAPLAVASMCSFTATAKDLVAGWNLIGNSFTQPIPVATAFGDSAVFNSVWTWDAGSLKWNFFTPAMTPTELQTYANSKGYGVLSQVQVEDGYWVNAKIATTLALTPVCANGGADYPTCTSPQQGATPTIAQGGLSWALADYQTQCPATFGGAPSRSYCTYRWATADALCKGSTINGLAGWRLPTQPELTALAQSGLASGGGGIWSSTPTPTPTYHYYVSLNGTTGTALTMADASYLNAMCVR